MNNKNIALQLIDYLKNKSYIDNNIYLNIYSNNFGEILKRVFSYFHEKLNTRFESMNNASSTSYRHYGANENRELIDIIKDLKKITGLLKNTNYCFSINNSYLQQLNYVSNFLEQNYGSTIPNNYLNFNTLYEPIFIFTDKDVSFESLDKYLPSSKANATQAKDMYISIERINKLLEIKNSRFDLSRLIQFCREINIAFSFEMYLSTGMLVRALIDHVPPIFDQANFSNVANNYYSKSRSFKQSMQFLQDGLRPIADSYLHIQAREKDSLPTDVQVNFSQHLDVLLGEICVILTEKPT